MKKPLVLLGHAAVVAGLIYALVTIYAIPAEACTPSECSALPQAANSICQMYGYSSGRVVSCDSSGWRIQCQPGGWVTSGTC